MAHTAANVKAEIILVVDTQCSVTYKQHSPLLLPGISVSVFITKVAPDVKLIELNAIVLRIGQTGCW